MNARTRRLRRSDFAVCAICAASVLMTLGAVGETGRRRAKEAVCQANLHRWGDLFGTIIEDNDGKFLTGTTDRGYWWPIQLSHELQDWKQNRLWFCPMAATPRVNEKGELSPTASAFNAWGIYQNPVAVYQGKTYQMTRNGIAGSYGLNGYVIAIPDQLGKTVNTYEGGVPATDGWRNLLDLPDGSRVPMLLDALRFDLWPQHTHGPAPYETGVWTSNHMANCAINRHDGAVNCLFVDGSVRKVGLKELWTLKWHRSFNTAGPWTLAGGVTPECWPEWIRPFKEY